MGCCQLSPGALPQLESTLNVHASPFNDWFT
jgi:hypothetical protein